ncbi:MAG: efflux RND transporter periplasmic adaptor subunit [Acidobacteria bacterium]|jgi:RND family efflux transporter MFP subunit|nr:MAG: efflux RND transporter periplasmic adaptor subunit [Acidobacteriota bacterium]
MPLLVLLLIFGLSLANELKVFTIVQGKVQRVYVKEGQRVRTGDLLVQIDPVLYTTQRKSLHAQLESQRINLEKVERDFKRYEELFNRGLLSRSEYEDWKSRYEREKNSYEAIKAQLERIDKLIEYCTIRSPLDGIVKRLLVRDGLFVNGTTEAHPILILEER